MEMYAIQRQMDARHSATSMHRMTAVALARLGAFLSESTMMQRCDGH